MCNKCGSKFGHDPDGRDSRIIELIVKFQEVTKDGKTYYKELIAESRREPICVYCEIEDIMEWLLRL